ncbi:diaminopimelate epimerase [Lysinibacillus sp. 2017]|uniref:diaminopimelate epimerase n=1 Tax=unclassified Lysinibacillus TaxID=2636778 RepID=UPI000D528866|nr:MULTISPECIES: diaminopimelate epimerase [unclassified Lysinibacillus]AWE07453.1 diaminopimelate epimerase [Lysinibacillus sp. 2017]TGN36617.1 diaminopimelate epimerase [Lysinibacillus sp. S2017]
MHYQLLKVHGSGNTFYLYDTVYEKELDWVQLTKWLCNKENENGADGLLLVLPSENADAKMRVINADGSEASMCGNGLRCMARYVCEKKNLNEAIIETMYANLHVKKEQAIFEQLPTYAVQISPVSFDLQSLPMHFENKTTIQNEILPVFSSDIRFTAVSVPNPHLIGIVEKAYIQDTSHQQKLASYLNEKNDYFPDGVNVSYVYPISDDEIFVRTYERGVGFTNACGTAMTASALIAQKNHYIKEEKVTVYNPGGFVQCKVAMQNNTYHLSLIGNATEISKWKLQAFNGNFTLLDCILSEEHVQYEKCSIFIKEKLGNLI